MIMLICLEEECACLHHRLLNCIEQGLNGEAEMLLQKLDHLCNAADASGKTLLHYSVEYCNAPMVQYLIEKGCNVNAQDSQGVTPLMLAVEKANMEISEILFKNDANILDLVNSEKESTLELSFYISLNSSEHRPILEMFFVKLNEDFLKNRNNMMKFIMNANSSMKVVFVVCGNVEMTTLMLQNGSKIDEFYDSTSGWTALQYALAFGKFETAKSLINLGANVSEKSKDHYSPLGCYAWYNFEDVDKESEVLKALLTRSTTLHVPNNYGHPNFIGFSDVTRLLLRGKKKTVKTILQNDIDIATRLHGRPLLDILIANTNIDIIDIIDFGITIDVNVLNLHDYSVLMTAVVNDSVSKVDFLLKRGADLKNNRGPALAIAAMGQFTKMTEILLQNGANAHYVFKDGETLIDRLLRCRESRPPTKIMVAHFALLETIDKSSVSESFHNSIGSRAKLKNYFGFCLRQVEELKGTIAYGTVTLFKLLTENEEKLVAYARNQQFVTEFETTMKCMHHLETYYVNSLQRRVAKAVEKAEVEMKVLPIIELLTGFSANVYHFIVYKIISNLDFQDLENLYNIEGTLITVK